MVALFGIEQERQSVVLVRDRTSAGLHSIRGLGWRKSAWQKNEFGLDVRRSGKQRLVRWSVFPSNILLAGMFLPCELRST